MKYAQDLIKTIGFSSFGNMNLLRSYFLAPVIDATYAATTDKVAREILLNSSKHPHRPL
jgi:hypothetical protein